MTKVLIALDDSDQSVHAARVAHDLFGDGAEYLAVSVAAQPVAWVEPGIGWGGVYAWSSSYAMPEDGTTWQELASDTAQGAADEAGVHPTRVVGDVGDPVRAVLDAAEDHGADVIVVGSHDKGWLDRLLTGSVSEGIVRGAHRPVLVVKSPHDDGRAGAASPSGTSTST
jgi:nucleotide-binding universal stress UspA family protein